MKPSEPPNCPKCGEPCDSAEMEAIHAPPAKTMYLTKWSCTRHKVRPTESAFANGDFDR